MRDTRPLQSVSVPLTVDLLVPTGTPQSTYLPPLVESVRLFDPGCWTGTEVNSVQVGAIQTGPARLVTCRIGGHSFYPGLWHTYPSQICPGHAEEQLMRDEQDRHRPLFTAIEHSSRLRPELIGDGRGAVLVHIPLGSTPAGADRSGQPDSPSYPGDGNRLMQAPCYRGRITAYGGDGRYYGELGYYPDPGCLLRAECIPVVQAQSERALYPHEWAARIVDHYHDLIDTDQH